MEISFPQKDIESSWDPLKLTRCSCESCKCLVTEKSGFCSVNTKCVFRSFDWSRQPTWPLGEGFFIAGLIVEMWAKTLTQNIGNFCTSNLTTVSNELSEIKFSFEEKPSGTKSTATCKMSETTPNIVHRVLTSDIIARIQAMDNEDDIATCQTDITNRKIPHQAKYKLGAAWTCWRLFETRRWGERWRPHGRFQITLLQIRKWLNHSPGITWDSFRTAGKLSDLRPS